MDKTYIFANASYGLYYGKMTSYDPLTGVAVVEDCRHVCRWFGLSGGITSLASDGLTGPRAAESRVGGKCNATLTNIVNVFEVSSKAAATIDAQIPA